MFLTDLLYRLRAVLRRKFLEDELDEEIRFHIDQEVEKHRQAGLSQNEARRRALMSFGGVDQVKEQCRDARGVRYLDEVSRSMRQALRGLRRSPVFACVAILILAIGIGASTAVFSLIDGVLLKPFGYAQPERLVIVSQSLNRNGDIIDSAPVSAAHFSEWKNRARSLEGIALFSGGVQYMTGHNGSPQQVFQLAVTPEFFELLGVHPVLGRAFHENESEHGQDRVLILSYSFWREHFQADPDVIGRKILLNEEPNEVVGIMPSGFWFPNPPRIDLWKPKVLTPGQFQPAMEFNHHSIARVHSSASIESARLEMDRLSQQLLEAAGESLEVKTRLVPLATAVNAGARQPLALLALSVGAVLLICCVNVANLLFARALARRREYVLKASLGAGRARLFLEMLNESFLLALAGATIGTLGAYWSVEVSPAWTPLNLPRMDGVEVNARVLGFAILVSVLSALLSAALPAWRISSAEAQEALRQGNGRFVSGHRRSQSLRGFLVSAQVAISLMLLIAAGLLVRSLDRLMNVEAGFETDSVITLGVGLPAQYQKQDERSAAFTRLHDLFGSLPGISAVGAVEILPLGGLRNLNRMLAEGEPLEQPMAQYIAATPGYFRAAGVRLHAGRLFTENEADLNSAVISQSAAERLWPGQNPLGRRFKRNGIGDWIRVVGVVADVRQLGLDREPTMTVYRPAISPRFLSFVLRSGLPLQSLGGAIQARARQLNPGLRLGPIRTMEDIVAESTARRHFQSTLLSAFAAVALFLACLGIYGVLSFSAAQRQNEIGLRMALGAQRANTISMMLRQGLRPVVFGILAGSIGAVIVSQSIASMLFGISPTDPVSFLVSIGALVAVAAVTCMLPAWRASRIDPMEALRCD